MVELTKYRTRLTENKRVTVEKELIMEYPEELSIIRSPEDAAIIGKDYMRIQEETEEYMYMICMNNKNRIIGIFEIAHGTVNSSIVGVREIFQKALLVNAVCILLIHNHPSGDPSPSKEDIEITKRIMKAGEIVGVGVLDHLIIGDRYVSLKDKGYI